MAETYTGNEGDDALAAGMDVMDGNEDRRDGWLAINKTRDMIADRTSAVTAIEKGGTGATTAAGARTSLGVVGTSQVALPNFAENGKIPIYNSFGQLTSADPSSPGHTASKQYVDAQISTRVGKVGDTMTGHLFLPNSAAATASYVVAYINGDGRVSKGASSERYKKHITEIDPARLGDLFPPLNRFQMRQGDGSWKYGYIAERLADSPDTEAFVVYDADGQPDSIDFIAFLIAQNAQLNQRLRALEEGP